MCVGILIGNSTPAIDCYTIPVLCQIDSPSLCNLSMGVYISWGYIWLCNVSSYYSIDLGGVSLYIICYTMDSKGGDHVLIDKLMK